MNSKGTPATPPALAFAVLVFIFALGLGIRLYHLDQTGGTFAPARQYRSALIARDYYFRMEPSIPDWRKHVANLNRQGHALLEPPIMEGLAAIAYRVTRSERLWVPRLFSAVFWVVGGVFLFLLVKEAISFEAGVISAAFYLLAPFGVLASRSFQPDPLMVTTLLGALYTIWSYHRKPSQARLALAVAASALTVFVKPVSIFVAIAVFVTLGLASHRSPRFLFTRQLAIYLLGAIAPAAVYFGVGLLLSLTIEAQFASSFRPYLFAHRYYWMGWLYLVGNTIGYLPVVGGVLGLLLARPGPPRALLAGLWVGYLCFGLAFNYHIHTHDYYQLQLIPIVAISLAPVGDLLVNPPARDGQRTYRQYALWGALSLAALLAGLQSRTALLNVSPGEVKEVRIAPRIGDAIAHSTKTVFLAWGDGMALEYYGDLSGAEWMHLAYLKGEDMSAKERYERFYAPRSPEYFIVTDLEELERQRSLKEFLMGEFPIAIKSEDYLVFDLRRRSAPSP